MDDIFSEGLTEHTRLRLRNPFSTTGQSSGNASWASLSRAEWLRAVRSRLKVLTDLPVGWDGYNAPKIAIETTLFAMQILQDIWNVRLATPDVSAMSNGGLMIEIARNGYELTVEVRGPYATTYIFERPAGGEDAGDIAADMTPLRAFINEMIAADTVVALVA